MSADRIVSLCSTAAAHWLPVFLDLAIKSLVVLAGAALLTSLLWRASAAMHHLVWCVAAASLLLLPALSLTLPQWGMLPSWLDLSDSVVNLQTESRSLASYRGFPSSSTSAGSVRGDIVAEDAVDRTLPGSPVATADAALVPASFENATAKGGSIFRVPNEPSLWLLLGWLFGMFFSFP